MRRLTLTRPASSIATFSCSNLLLDRRGKVWVADFGLAKIHEGQSLMQSGDAVGTLRYMGPERFHGWTDPRSDVYSLGASAGELELLFGAADRASLVRAILSEIAGVRERADGQRLVRHVGVDALDAAIGSFVRVVREQLLPDGRVTAACVQPRGQKDNVQFRPARALLHLEKAVPRQPVTTLAQDVRCDFAVLPG